MHGTGQSLLIGLGATGVGVGLAVVFGSWAALGGRWADAIIGRAIEVLFAFPILLLAMVFIAVYGPSVPTLVLAVGLGIAPGYARMVRAQVMSVHRSGYVQAARALGHPPAKILVQHVLPNALRPLLAVLTLGIGQSIVWASGLAFLGFGVAPPSPEWASGSWRRTSVGILRAPARRVWLPTRSRISLPTSSEWRTRWGKSAST